MTKQKIVIKVEMTCDRCRSKAMALAAATGGVDSVALAGDGRDQVIVMGDGVDSIKLTSALRKKVGPAQLLQVAEAGKKKEGGEKKPSAAVPSSEYPWYYHYPPPKAEPASVMYGHPADGYAYGYACQTRPGTNCSIM